MKTRPHRLLGILALFLPLVMVSGCGGGGGGHTSSDAIEILRQDGLEFILEPAVPAGPLGTQMEFVFRVENQGLGPRTLELRPRGDQAGGRTCLGTITYDDGSGNRSVVYTLSCYDTASIVVQPGDPAWVGRFVWDQVRQDNGQAATPGYYTFSIVLDNLYVDGKKPADWPTFEVRGENRVYCHSSEPWVDPRERLREEGLIVSLGLDKVIYRKGEPIPIWFEVKNEGTQTRTLEARVPPPMPDFAPTSRLMRGAATRSGEFLTYMGGFMYYTPDGHDYVPARSFSGTTTITKQVAPGETIHFLDYVWNQVNGDGSPAQAGYYDAYMVIFDLYVDGEHLCEPIFEVDVCAPIRIDE